MRFPVIEETDRTVAPAIFNTMVNPTPVSTPVFDELDEQCPGVIETDTPAASALGGDLHDR